MSDNESIFSIVSIDIDENNKEEDSSNSEGEELINEIGMENLNMDDLKINFMNIIECEHNFEKDSGLDSNPCNWCKWYPSKYKRAKCNKYFIEGCISCIETQLRIITQKRKEVYTNEPLINLKVLVLEAKVKELEERIVRLEKGKNVEQELPLDNQELMNEESNTLICNEDKNINTVKILAKLQIEKYEIETLALIDSGCTKSILNKKIVPPELINTLEKPLAAMQMDGTHNIYKHYIDKAQISFLNTCSRFCKPTYKMDKIWVRDLDIRVDFVLGLDFILHNKAGTLITKDGILFMKNITYTSVFTNKIYTKVRHKEKCCENCENNIECT